MRGRDEDGLQCQSLPVSGQILRKQLLEFRVIYRVTKAGDVNVNRWSVEETSKQRTNDAVLDSLDGEIPTQRRDHWWHGLTACHSVVSFSVCA